MKVLNKKDIRNMAGKVYIGRPSLFCNPYVIGKDGDRDTVIQKYENYLMNSPRLLSKLHELKDKDLVCYCHPLKCHGDVLVRLIESGYEYSPSPHKLGIVGCRWFDGEKHPEVYGIFKEYLDKAIKHLNLDFNLVISGGALGVDSMAIDYAKEVGVKWKEYPAEWTKYGKSAGFIRNTTIVENSTIVLAFWDRKSSGTADTIEKCMKFNKEFHIIDLNKIVDIVDEKIVRK